MYKFSIKFYFIFLIVVLFSITVFLGVKTPSLHKPLVINVLDYFVKINPDNSKTIIEKTTVIQNKGNY